MSSAANEIVVPPSPPQPAVEIHEGAARAFWRVLTNFDSSKMSVSRALRNSVGVAIPLVAGYALGMPRGGLVIASGALNVAYSDGSDPYIERAKRMLTSSFLCALAVFAGAISGTHYAIAVAVAAVWAFIAGLLVSISPAAGDLGVISLVSLLIYSAQKLAPHQAALSGVLALAGGLFQTFLSLALWPVQRYEPERRALGNFYFELAQIAEKSPQPHTAPPASEPGTQAQTALSGLARDATLEGVRYRALLTQAERLRLGLLILSRLRTRMNRESEGHPAVEILDAFLREAGQVLESVAGSLLNARPAVSARQHFPVLEGLTRNLRQSASTAAPSFLSAMLQDARFQMDALAGQLRAAFDLATHTTPAGQAAFVKEEALQPWWLRFSGRIATLRANLNLGSSAFRHALRLAAMVALGDTVGQSLSWRRSYWLPMTIVLVLKPEFTTTFSRGLLRIAGTIVGLMLATALFLFLPSSPAYHIIMIFAFTFLLRWVGPANYGIFGIAVSALVVLLIAITGIAPKEVIWARGTNTALGGALALLAYWVWPTWERTRVSERVAQMLDAYRNYYHALAHSLLHLESPDPRELDRARLAARTARSNLEASVDRLGAEPGTSPEQMSRLNAMLASSHRFVHAVMALEAGQLRTAGVPVRPAFRTFAADVEKTFALLAGALRGKRFTAKELPDLREDYNQLLQSGDPKTELYALSNVEADRITNSLNTLREQILDWTRTPQADQSTN
jgi:uncharacterized membrane protein YccC